VIEPEKSLVREADQMKPGEELFRSIGCVACHVEPEKSLAGIGSKMTAASLARYIEAPLKFDPSGYMPDMQLTPAEASRIAEYLAGFRREGLEAATPKGNPLRGRELVRISGCLNCHSLNEQDARLTSELKASAFERLASSGGCLSLVPARGLPRYSLSDTERAALAAYLKQPDRSEAPVQDLHRLMNRFQCQACHDWHGPARLGASELPPPLTTAGEKLRSGWLEKVLIEKKRVRPWMELRMPHYSPEEIAPLVSFLASAAGVAPDFEPPRPSANPDMIQRGIQLAGPGGALFCVACHDLHGQPAYGAMRGPDLVEMHERIRDNWFRRWMREPSRIIPGTAMPAFFSEIPADEASLMIESLWAGLSTGRNFPALAPVHNVEDYILRVDAEPVLFRTFLERSSSRSIAVGLPEGQNFAFDALHCRLRYAWSGGFLDVQPVWSGRGGGNALPLGETYYTAPDIFPIRFGHPEKEPRVRFKGYELIEGHPQFMYEADGILIKERISSAPNGKGLVRAFQMGPVVEDIWFVAESRPDIVIHSPSGPFDSGRLRIPAGEAVRFEVVIEQSD
jgi:mono/diheme cytochrome c family protein